MPTLNPFGLFVIRLKNYPDSIKVIDLFKRNGFGLHFPPNGVGGLGPFGDGKLVSSLFEAF
ncbi:hypothetical protein SDC9_136970 [bioreactor metagenome]|uniref:Uncharacterized protein n=1 Tax=bioreactor metagenome TaxID=1076179 RepID=A0A645DKQ7_9ZZZZ